MRPRSSPVLRLLLGLVLALTAAGALAPPGMAAPYPWEQDTEIGLLSLPKNHSPAPVAADWDGDGDEDLVVGLRSADLYGGMAVALRGSDGDLGALRPAFRSGTFSTSTGWTLYARPTVADWDGDGRVDLLYGTYYAHKGVRFCRNEAATGAVAVDGADCAALRTASGALVGASSGSNIAYLSPEVTDWDGDGDLDLLVGAGADTPEKGVRFYENTGTPTEPVLADAMVLVSPATPGTGGETYYEPAAVDVDDDGDRDLLVAGGQVSQPDDHFRAYECLNVGTGSEPRIEGCTSRVLPGLVNNVLDATDWDGDGYLDLIAGFHSGWIPNDVTLFHGAAPDSDGDGLSDSIDNCRDLQNPAEVMLDGENPTQLDTDDDGRGDACDPDADGDAVPDTGDNCVLARNSGQVDVDGDGRGDACDASDDRPGHPGAGSHEAAMAEKTQWGRRPVIVQRADAMSIGYRQEIAEALTTEALDRGLPFSLAVIPWNADRFGPARGSDFLNEVIADPDFEAVQHGTYHNCMYVPWLETRGTSAAEFDCGMDARTSYNLMRVGQDAMLETVDFDRASHRLTGFIPPTDAYDDAAAEAMQALGYDWVASAWYAEAPELVHVDDQGLLHIPWSQIACGNGLAGWTDCQRTDVQGVAAHSGVDCDDPEICMPTQDGKDYSDWARYAGASLADRCRNDFERYGVCSVLYELTSYDDGTGSGALDPVAFAGYQQTLTELEELAADTGAVFLTLGQYAASLRAEDLAGPAVTVAAPTAGEHSYTDTLTVAVEVRDDVSGVHDVAITLDGDPVTDGHQVDLGDLALGEHTLTVRAEDVAGNVTTEQVRFTVVDDVAPDVALSSPAAGSYEHHEVVPVTWTATDARSEVESVVVTLDGATYDAEELDLLGLALGEHTLTVRATDTAGNTGEASATFTVSATLGSLAATVDRLAEEDRLADPGLRRSLEQAVAAARAAVERDQPEVAVRRLDAMVELLVAQSGKHLTTADADLLVRDVRAVQEALAGS